MKGLVGYICIKIVNCENNFLCSGKINVLKCIVNIGLRSFFDCIRSVVIFWKLKEWEKSVFFMFYGVGKRLWNVI